MNTRVKRWIMSIGDDARKPAHTFGWLMRVYGGQDGRDGYEALCSNFPIPLIYKQRDMWLALFGGYGLRLPPTDIWEKMRLTTLAKKLDHPAVATLVEVAAQGEDAEAIAELKRLFAVNADWQVSILHRLLEQGTPMAFSLTLDMLAVTTKLSDTAAYTLAAKFEPQPDSFALPILCAWAVERLQIQRQNLSTNQCGFLMGLCRHSDTQKARELVARWQSSQ